LVQVIENYAGIEGQLVEARDSAEVADHGVLVVQVDRVNPVDGYPNLLAQAQGQRLEVLVRKERLGAYAVGQPLQLRVRRASPSAVFAADD